MKYTADCPECLAEFEVPGPTTASLGIQCVSCGHKFIPDKVHRVYPTEEEVTTPKLNVTQERLEHEEYEKLKSKGEGHFVFGAVSISISIFLAILAFANDSDAGFFEASGAFFSISLILLFFSSAIKSAPDSKNYSSRRKSRSLKNSNLRRGGTKPVNSCAGLSHAAMNIPKTFQSFPLSPGERAGVRASVKFNCIIAAK